MPDSVCISCQSVPADFDVYLCHQCAAELGMTLDNTRMAYAAMFRVFAEFARRVAYNPNGDKMNIEAVYTAPAVNFHNARRLHYFCRLFEAIRGVKGSVIECGVGGGQTLMYLASIVYDGGVKRKVWGFDSFSGPQTISVGDIHPSDSASYVPIGDATNFEKNLEEFTTRLASFGIPRIWVNSNLAMVVGFFEETLRQYDQTSVALLHLDCNYYASYRECLNYFYPLMARGGIIALDDYGGSWDYRHFPGAARVIHDFCQNTGETLTRDPDYGKYYICVARPLATSPTAFFSTVQT